MSERVIQRILAISILLLLTACSASGQLASVQNDMRAKNFSAVADKGRIYVIRPSGIVGTAVLTHIMINGRLAAAVGPGNFFMLDVSKGSYIFNVLALSLQGGQPHQFEINSGEIYFIEVSHVEGIFKRLSTKEGEQLVNDSNRIEINIDPNKI